MDKYKLKSFLNKKQVAKLILSFHNSFKVSHSLGVDRTLNTLIIPCIVLLFLPNVVSCVLNNDKFKLDVSISMFFLFGIIASVFFKPEMFVDNAVFKYLGIYIQSLSIVKSSSLNVYNIITNTIKDFIAECINVFLKDYIENLYNYDVNKKEGRLNYKTENVKNILLKLLIIVFVKFVGEKATEKVKILFCCTIFLSLEFRNFFDKTEEQEKKNKKAKFN